MTNSKQTEALKLALEALKLSSVTVDSFGVQGKTREAITALREALTSVPDWASEAKEQPAQHEPVAAQSVMTVRIWRDKNSDKNAEFKNWHKLPDGEHILYTSPPAQPVQRKPLTLGQKQRLWSSVGDKPTLKDRVNAYGTAIEAAHGITKGNT